MRGIFFSPRTEITTRFLASAFYYKEDVAFGFVNTKSAGVTEMLARYNINKHRETLLLFNEETNSPVASISVSNSFVVYITITLHVGPTY